ncbi:hypothetical protein FHS18_002243 [Paenibacillus phyllosphaerae]|uniref:Uncharacterized protein n=1 Tax=Paenibacillus phyllosphaerae TaxID=274593 RepID=A0A7W5AXP0_9BACL|nr:hypothetical protein [Paenibacillus phyllosphaerae]MBB3110176.1 hypothetical protein [Paenibacillus phyllosphaerae]
MRTIQKIISRTFLILFTICFIGPAFVFSVLVLGFTETWQPGLSMLLSALLLVLIMKLLLSGRIVVYSRSKRGSRIVYEPYTDFEAPPTLHEIDHEIDALHRNRQDRLLEELLQEREKRL